MSINGWVRHWQWRVAQFFAYLLGRPIFAPVFRSLAIFTLHCLGYGNAGSRRYSGEHWFVTQVIAHERVRTCIDVGANTGQFALELAPYVESMYSFEPFSSSFAKLEKNAPANVRPYRYAISDEVGELPLYLRKDKTEQATLHATVGSSDSSEVVPVIRLDDFIKQHAIRNIDFVKIDTEGHELEVLRGARNLINTAPPRFVQFEFGEAHLRRGHTIPHFQEALPHYTLFRLMPHGMIRIVPERATDNFFMFSNIVAIRNNS